MAQKPKHKRRMKGSEGGRFVALRHWIMDRPAYRHLSPAARALYIELKRGFNGSNNGRIALSYRDAAVALNMHRNSVGKLFRELQNLGFIIPAVPHHLGPDGVGKTTLWILTEEGVNGQRPTMDFAKWSESEKQNPRTKTMTPRHTECASSAILNR